MRGPCLMASMKILPALSKMVPAWRSTFVPSYFSTLLEIAIVREERIVGFLFGPIGLARPKTHLSLGLLLVKRLTGPLSWSLHFPLKRALGPAAKT